MCSECNGGCCGRWASRPCNCATRSIATVASKAESIETKQAPRFARIYVGNEVARIVIQRYGVVFVEQMSLEQVQTSKAQLLHWSTVLTPEECLNRRGITVVVPQPLEAGDQIILQEGTVFTRWEIVIHETDR